MKQPIIFKKIIRAYKFCVYMIISILIMVVPIMYILHEGILNNHWYLLFLILAPIYLVLIYNYIVKYLLEFMAK